MLVKIGPITPSNLKTSLENLEPGNSNKLRRSWYSNSNWLILRSNRASQRGGSTRPLSGTNFLISHKKKSIHRKWLTFIWDLKTYLVGSFWGCFHTVFFCSLNSKWPKLQFGRFHQLGELFLKTGFCLFFQVDSIQVSSWFNRLLHHYWST